MLSCKYRRIWGFFCFQIRRETYEKDQGVFKNNKRKL